MENETGENEWKTDSVNFFSKLKFIYSGSTLEGVSRVSGSRIEI